MRREKFGYKGEIVGDIGDDGKNRYEADGEIRVAQRAHFVTGFRRLPERENGGGGGLGGGERGEKGESFIHTQLLICRGNAAFHIARSYSFHSCVIAIRNAKC